MVVFTKSDHIICQPIKMKEEARRSFSKRTDSQNIPNGKQWDAGKEKTVSFLCTIPYSKRGWIRQVWEWRREKELREERTSKYRLLPFRAVAKIK